MKQFIPTFAMFGAVLLWASSVTGNKFALIQVSVAEVFAFRLLGAAIVMWTVGLILRRDFRLRSRVPLLMGMLEPGLVTFFIVLGLSHTSAVNASVVWGVMPLTQPLMARVFLKEPLQPSVLIGALLAVIGTVLLFVTKSQDGTGSIVGDLYLVCAVVCASLNQMLARRVASTHGQPIVTTSYQLLSASILAVAYFLFAESPGEAYRGVDGVTFAVLCFLIVATAGPFLLYNFALQTLTVGRVSLFAPLIGPLGVIIATLVFHEPLSAPILLAILLALSGVLLPSWGGARALWDAARRG